MEAIPSSIGIAWSQYANIGSMLSLGKLTIPWDEKIEAHEDVALSSLFINIRIVFIDEKIFTCNLEK